MKRPEFVTIEVASPRPGPSFDDSIQVHPLVLEVCPMLNQELSYYGKFRTWRSNWQESFLNKWGVHLPQWKLRVEHNLGNRQYQILLRTHLVGNGEANMSCSFFELSECETILEEMGPLRRPPKVHSEGLHPVTKRKGFWLVNGWERGESGLKSWEYLGEHLWSVTESHLPSLMTLEQTQYEIDLLEAHYPKLVRQVKRKYDLVAIREIFCGLLKRRISLRDSESLLKSLASR